MRDAPMFCNVEPRPIRGRAACYVSVVLAVAVAGCGATRSTSIDERDGRAGRVVEGWNAPASADLTRRTGRSPDDARADIRTVDAGVMAADAVARRRRESLLAVVESWKGTPYRYGGETRRGVDCSAFVQAVYRDGLDLRIPRSTDEQRSAGTVIDRSSIGFGDLVFFRLESNQRHVGVSLGGGRFAHSASSSGVTVSGLDEPYWARRFDRAVRFDKQLAIAADRNGAGVTAGVMPRDRDANREPPAAREGRPGW